MATFDRAKRLRPRELPVTAVVVGAGDRGTTYASYAAAFPGRLKIVGVAEPIQSRRECFQKTYGLSDAAAVSDWRAFADRPQFADAAFICTQDAFHRDPAIALADAGYAILLEKPMATSEADCVDIVEAIRRSGVLLAVCHVMRYTRYTSAIKSLIERGAIGEIVSLQHLEPVGHWHYAHSYVRGNWRKTSDSAFMLLSKSCHDLDWIHYLVGRPCISVSSFGSLKHFTRANKPAEAGSAMRCTECAYEPKCPYSAERIYLGRLRDGVTWWPVDVVSPNPTIENVSAALRNGQYGRCVYECDNDVVDHQVVNMLFEGGATAAFTMTAFSNAGGRRTRIMGSRGEIWGDGTTVELRDFLSDSTQTINVEAGDSGPIIGWHGGGDHNLIDSFVNAVAAGDSGLVLSGAEDSLESHRIAFAAERARLSHRVVDL